jgi:hypothetical protein
VTVIGLAGVLTTLGTTTEGGGVNARDWPKTEGPEVRLEPPHNAGGCGRGAMLSLGSGRQSRGGVTQLEEVDVLILVFCTSDCS